MANHLLTLASLKRPEAQLLPTPVGQIEAPAKPLPVLNRSRRNPAARNAGLSKYIRCF
jgi:hypothetical protein